MATLNCVVARPHTPQGRGAGMISMCGAGTPELTSSAIARSTGADKGLDHPTIGAAEALAAVPVRPFGQHDTAAGGKRVVWGRAPLQNHGRRRTTGSLR